MSSYETCWDKWTEPKSRRFLTHVHQPTAGLGLQTEITVATF